MPKKPRTTRRSGWIAGVALAVALPVVTALAPAQAAPAQATTTQADAGPTVEVLAVDELGYGAGIDVQLLLRGLEPGPDGPGPASYYRIALAAPGIADLAARPDAVASQSGRFAAGTVEAPRTFRLPAYTLEPGTTYSLYVVPDGGNAFEQAEAPIALDWAALAPDVAITAGPPVTGPYGSTPLTIGLRDVPRGSVVTVTGLPGGAFRLYPNGDAVTTYTRPGDPVGTYTYTATLDVPDGAIGDGLTATGQVTIVPAPTVLGTSFVKAPTPTRTGQLRTVVARAGGAVRVSPVPIAWKIYRGTQVVWYSGVLRQAPGTDVVVGLPKLARGTYRLVVGYGGTTNLQPATTTRSFTVR